MSGDAAPAAAPAKTPKKKVVKPKKPAAHPKLIKQAVSALKEHHLARLSSSTSSRTSTWAKTRKLSTAI